MHIEITPGNLRNSVFMLVTCDDSSRDTSAHTTSNNLVKLPPPTHSRHRTDPATICPFGGTRKDFFGFWNAWDVRNIWNVRNARRLHSIRSIHFYIPYSYIPDILPHFVFFYIPRHIKCVECMEFFSPSEKTRLPLDPFV